MIGSSGSDKSTMLRYKPAERTRSGMNIENRVELWGDVSQYNEHYLNTKVKRSGHLLDSSFKEAL
ncbi:hypothetical protein A4R27_26020 [Priestia endophytica]|nr:hypothetical protein A4R27_26020 [Priestia endophytica]